MKSVTKVKFMMTILVSAGERRARSMSAPQPVASTVMNEAIVMRRSEKSEANTMKITR